VQLQNSNNETLLNPEFAERFELNDDWFEIIFWEGWELY